MTPAIARLKITMDDIEPEVIRRIEVPLDIRLDRLHEVLQAAIGWTNSHLWELRVRDIRWGTPDPDWPNSPLNAKKSTLLDVIEDTGAKTLHYMYDFGDGWEHTIKTERISPAEPDTLYPQLLDAKDACPPEDIGGAPGYYDFLEAIADPGHENHAHYTEYYPANFDPHAVACKPLQMSSNISPKNGPENHRRKSQPHNDAVMVKRLLRLS
jgi:hypothetical protein